MTWGEPHGGPWGGPLPVEVSHGKGNITFRAVSGKFSIIGQQEVELDSYQKVCRRVPVGSDFRIQIAMKTTHEAVFLVIVPRDLSVAGDLTYRFGGSDSFELDQPHAFFGSGLLEYASGSDVVESLYFTNSKVNPVWVEVYVGRVALQGE